MCTGFNEQLHSYSYGEDRTNKQSLHNTQHTTHNTQHKNQHRPSQCSLSFWNASSTTAHPAQATARTSTMPPAFLLCMCFLKVKVKSDSAGSLGRATMSQRAAPARARFFPGSFHVFLPLQTPPPARASLFLFLFSILKG